jgi:hypothetical protein
LLIASPAGFAQEERAFDDEKIEQYKNDKDFDYSELSAESSNIFELIRAKIIGFLSKIFGNRNAVSLLSLGWRLLLIAVIVVAVVLILRLQFGQALSRNPTSVSEEVTTILNQPIADFSKLYDQAVSEQDYRSAIRFLFLKGLRDLHEQGVIKIADWKTTYDYQFEIPEAKRSVFQQINQLFEQAWFGEYPIDNAQVAEARELTQKLTHV